MSLIHPAPGLRSNREQQQQQDRAAQIALILTSWLG